MDRYHYKEYHAGNSSQFELLWSAYVLTYDLTIQLLEEMSDYFCSCLTTFMRW